MKKRHVSMLLVFLMAATLMAGCVKKEAAPETTVVETEATTVAAETQTQPESLEGELPEEELTEAEIVVEMPVAADAPEGKYYSELTNELIDVSIKDQRPIAVLVDNEKTALPHYNTSNADIVYEIMNSLQNNRVTRFLCIVKDWKNIEQMGNIRSSRPSFFPLAAEWNAVALHDGGRYMDAYLSQPWCDHLSGGFLRVKNGKATEFTEYVSAEDKNGYRGIISRMRTANVSEYYTKYYPGAHYKFAAGEVDLSAQTDSFSATAVDFPFPHNSSILRYNESTGTYDYSEYNMEYKDAGTGTALTFKNVLIQKCDYHKCEDTGYYIEYDMNTSGMDGYYLTNGKAIPVKWSKGGDTEVTHYYDLSGNEIEINTGKTYVALVPSDKWSELKIQ